MKPPYFRKYLTPHIVGLLSSRAAHRARRKIFEMRRRTERRGHEIFFFHDMADPYSHLLGQVLPDLVAAYDVTLTQHLVPPSDPESTPQAALLAAHARLDAARIAAFHGLEFNLERMEKKRQRRSGEDLTARLHEGSEALARMGHYQGGMLFYAGEWYWGLDRLPYLEERLRSLGASRNPASPILFRRPEDAGEKFTADCNGQNVEMFFSFRSPYSYLALEKLPAFVKRTGIDLRLRPVMPMITRGVPLSGQKRRYIWFDSTREARRQGIAFGKIADPLIEEGYKNALALFPLAEARGKALEFSRAAMCAAFAEGRYLSDESVLRRLTNDLGMEWPKCSEALGNEGWRAAAEENAAALRKLGLWGVPSFRCGEVSVWGQDRMWLLERLIRDGKNNLASSQDCKAR